MRIIAVIAAAGLIVGACTSEQRSEPTAEQRAAAEDVRERAIGRQESGELLSIAEWSAINRPDLIYCETVPRSTNDAVMTGYRYYVEHEFARRELAKMDAESASQPAPINHNSLVKAVK